MKQFTSFLFVAAAFFYLTSCSGDLDSGNTHQGPIVLGDSSTIVTETDTAYLNDQVADIEPQQLIQHATQEPAATSKEQPPLPKETPKPAAATEETPSHINGLTIDFGQGVHVSFSGIATREFQQQNPEKEAGVSYAITSGDLPESNLIISGLKSIKVLQRYQSELLLKSGREKLSLQNMGSYLSEWQNISGNGSSFSLNSLQNIKYKSVSHNTIRNGVRAAARSGHLSRSATNFWIDAIRRTRSANDAPCQVELDNVQWQISGKTASGKSFHKTIRLEP